MLKLITLTILLKLVASKPMIFNDTFNYKLSMEEMTPSMSEIFDKNPKWLFEGDIALLDSRKALASANLWNNAHVDYVCDQTLSNDVSIAIGASLNEWQSKTCLTFTDQTSNSNFDTTLNHVRFTDDSSGCFSYLGAVSLKPQPINLGNGCQFAETVIHEIGHAIGFVHEQSRSDRNSFVRILSGNIENGKSNNFLIQNTNNHGVNYDFFSIMHYDPWAFASPKHETNTIQSVNPKYQYVMGRGKVLSFNDEKTANEMYCTAGYAAACGGAAKNCNSGYLQQDCSCKCPPGTSGSNCQNGQVAETGLPCGQTITSAGTFTTPNYPDRANTWAQRSCVWTIQAPANKRVNVYFDDFSFYPKSSINNKNVCYFDLVEVRLSGSNDEVPFKCGNELDKTTHQSTANEMVILINSRFTQDYYEGMKFTVSFI